MKRHYTGLSACRFFCLGAARRFFLFKALRAAFFCLGVVVFFSCSTTEKNILILFKYIPSRLSWEEKKWFTNLSRNKPVGEICQMLKRVELVTSEEEKEEEEVVTESKKLKTQKAEAANLEDEQDEDNNDAGECSDICEPDDQEEEDGLFVVHYARHTDCYKRGSSYSTVVGIFRKHEDAVSVALPYFDELLDTVRDENGDVHFDDPILQRFVDQKALTSAQKLHVCKKLCQLQKMQEGEFSLQASGIYLSIQQVVIQ